GKRLGEEASPLLQNQISEYREFVRQFVSENAIMEKMFLVVVPWHPATISAPSIGGFKMPFFGKKADPAAEEKKKQDSETEEVDSLLKANLPQLSQRISQVVEGLTQIGLDAVILKNEELIELFFNFYNPESVERETSVGAPGGDANAKR